MLHAAARRERLHLGVAPAGRERAGAQPRQLAVDHEDVHVLEVADLDEAISYAEKIPNVGYGAVEIRPVLDVSQMQ